MFKASPICILGLLLTTLGAAPSATDSAAAAQSELVGAAATATGQGAHDPSILTVEFAVDYVSRYYFRGIVQETQGLIMQLGAEAGLSPFESDGALSGVALTLGAWSSLHGGPTGQAQLSTLPAAWYEADLYAGVGFTFAEALALGVSYTLMASPNGAFGSVDEVGFTLAWDDSALYGGRFGGFQPTALMAVEVDGSAFSSRGPWMYLERG